MDSGTATAEREEILAAMRQMATEGSPVRQGDEVSMGDIDAAAIIGKIVEPGVVAIYDTRTGEKSLTSRHMLAQQTTKVRPDGSQVFSDVPPRDSKGKVIEPKRGKLKCMLHPDDPNRKLYDEWGLPICTKEGLPSPTERKNHMRGRHKREWQTIEEYEKDAEKQRDRKEQQEYQERLIAAAASGTVLGGTKSKKAG